MGNNAEQTKTKLELEFEEEEVIKKDDIPPEDPNLDFTTSKLLGKIEGQEAEDSASEMQILRETAHGSDTAVLSFPQNMPPPAPTITQQQSGTQVLAPPKMEQSYAGTSIRHLAKLREDKLQKRYFKKKSASNQPTPMPIPRPPQYERMAAEPVRRPAERHEEMANEADVRVVVAEVKGEVWAEFLSDAKLLEYKINQILNKLNSKNPLVMKYINSIRSLLAEFRGRKKF
ncbi:MAG: hypothetical protein WCG27_09190 [Pseudomonadota bacterium]